MTWLMPWENKAYFKVRKVKKRICNMMFLSRYLL
jgi:hypothetical protein